MLSAIWLRRFQYAFIAIIVTTVGFSLYQWNASRASTQKTAPNNGLVGYWSFDENTGTQAGDASGNNNTGTLTNGPTWTDGKKGQSVSFDGTDDYITMGDRSSLEINNNSLAFGGWFYINAYPAVNNRMFLITKGNGGGFEYELSVNGYSTNHLVATLFQPGGSNYIFVSSNTVPPLNTWFHVMGVWDKDAVAMRVYYNGVLENTSTTTSGSLHTTRTASFEIGRRNDNAEAKLNGKADEVRVYNRALSGTEIANIVSASKLNVSPVSNLTSGLVGYWTFDGKDTPWSSSSAGTATDRSGSSNTGTLTNMSRTTTPAEGKLGQALNFDNVDDEVSVATDVIGSGATSICAWIYPRSHGSSGYGRIVSSSLSGQTIFLIDGSADKLAFTSNSSTSIYSPTAVTFSKWTYVCATRDASGAGIIYMDGVAVVSGSTGTPVANATPIRIGNANGGTRTFDGLIDEVRIYNRTLSAGEVQSLYDLGASDKVNSSVSQSQGTGRLDSGLAGYWKLDDASGTTATDSSTNGNNGTLTNGPTWGTGRINGDVVFDGVNDYIDLGNRSVLNLTNNFSVSMWLNINNLTQSDWNRFFGRDWSDDNNRPFYMEYDYTAHQYRAVWRNGGTFGAVSGKTLTAVGWQHFVVTFKDGVVKSYSDGVLAGSASGAVQPANVSNNTYIGSIAGAYPFPGSIDEVRVYNRALSDDEIAQLYRLTTPTGVDTSLKGYWSFNGPDLSGTTAYDRSGAGNTGTLTNGPTITEGKSGQALNFDGTDDYVNMGSSATLDLTTSHTMSAWINPTTLPTATSELAVFGHGSASCCGTGYAVGLKRNNGGGYDAVYYRTSAGLILEPHITLTTKVWHHIVVTWNGTTATMYIDGSNSASNSLSSPISLFNSNSVIGRERSDSAYLFNGQIDEVRVYNRALSGTEVSALYNAGR